MVRFFKEKFISEMFSVDDMELKERLEVTGISSNQYFNVSKGVLKNFFDFMGSKKIAKAPTAEELIEIIQYAPEIIDCVCDTNIITGDGLHEKLKNQKSKKRRIL